MAFNNRAELWMRKKEFDKALADLSESIRLDPENVFAHNNQAWLWVTCADGRYRSGARAVDSATRACELTKWKKASNVDTLAAAYAEHGEFDKAVQRQEEAIKMFADADKKARRGTAQALQREKAVPDDGMSRGERQSRRTGATDR